MFYFLVSFLLSLIITWSVAGIARRLDIVDIPDSGRHRHGRRVPLLGGVAIFVSFWLVVFYVLGWHPVRGVELIANSLGATFVGGLILIFIGVADDIKPFSATGRLVLTLVTMLIVAGWLGGYLSKITNPLGGFLEIGASVGVVLTFMWLAGMTYTTKILDGLDGLAAGVVIIGALVIYFLTATARFYQPNVGLIALIFAGSCLGFLFFNFSPAKIFLGESGSLFIGFILGVLAVIGGGKLATAVLVMAIPIFDLARVMLVRLLKGHHLFKGDREHLHFKLLDRGFPERRIVLMYYFMAIFFGISTLFLQSYQKLVALFFLVIIMLIVGWKLSSSEPS